MSAPLRILVFALLPVVGMAQQTIILNHHYVKGSPTGSLIYTASAKADSILVDSNGSLLRLEKRLEGSTRIYAFPSELDKRLRKPLLGRFFFSNLAPNPSMGIVIPWTGSDDGIGYDVILPSSDHTNLKTVRYLVSTQSGPLDGAMDEAMNGPVDVVHARFLGNLRFASIETYDARNINGGFDSVDMLYIYDMNDGTKKLVARNVFSNLESDVHGKRLYYISNDDVISYDIFADRTLIYEERLEVDPTTALRWSIALFNEGRNLLVSSNELVEDGMVILCRIEDGAVRKLTPRWLFVGKIFDSYALFLEKANLDLPGRFIVVEPESGAILAEFEATKGHQVVTTFLRRTTGTDYIDVIWNPVGP